MELTVVPACPDAVYVRNVQKSFSVRRTTTPVLQGLNLTVPRGTIYGLLGPSGCGKTTLLRCIMGRCTPKEGLILVHGHIPGTKGSGIPGPKVGYMPQEIALQNEMTVKETLMFFGRVAGMSTKRIVTRRKFLMKLLNVPNSSNYVEKLSGGQKRRVSFAVALLCEPSLLILDEPTVGVDPLLRKRIWNYLNSLVQSTNTTVMITTHYIEEARQSDNVGMMLNGRLLAESPPDLLLKQFSCTTLEDVFLKLCLVNDCEEEGHTSGTNAGTTSFTVDPTADMFDSSKLQCVSVSGREQLALCGGDDDTPDSRGTLHEEGTGDVQEVPSVDDDDVQVDLTCPASVIPATGAKRLRSKSSHQSWHLPPKMNAVANFLEMPKFHRVYAMFWKNLIYFVRHPGSIILEFILPPLIMIVFAVAVGKPLFGLRMGIVNDDLGEFGNVFANSIDTHTIEKVYFDNYNDAFQASRDGDTWGVLEINANFTESIINRFVHGSLVDNGSIFEGAVQASLDTSNQQVSFVINAEMLYSFRRFSRTILLRLGLNPELGDLGVKTKEFVYGKGDVNFAQFFAPAFMSSVSFFMAMALTALMIVIDRQDGILERQFVAGVEAIEIIIAQLLAQMVVMCVQVLLMLIVVFGIFQFVCNGSVFLISCICLSEGLSGIALGLLISSVCDEQTTAIVLSLAMWFISVLINGVIWPLEGIPELVRYVSYAFPLTMPIESMRNVMNRGWDITYSGVYTGLGVSFTWVIVFIAISWTVSRMKS